jgi:two-component system cell cycle sensor histidine kinase/response regulator CckA
MNSATDPVPRRILVIDDNPAIHDDIRKILTPDRPKNVALNDAKALLFGDDTGSPDREEFEIDSAFQGAEGLKLVEAAAASGRPYSMAFVDVRMPPGWDGVETILHIWKEHPDLQVVICTAYSDYSWEDMVAQIGRSSSMVVLKKPFDNIEVLQLAHALTEKWSLTRKVRAQIRNLDGLVEERTSELRAANEKLKLEITERLRVESALVLSEERFSKAFNANPIPLAIQSFKDGLFSETNTGFRELTGYTSEEIIGKGPDELHLWEDTGVTTTVLELLASKGSVRHLPCRLQSKSNGLREILLSIEMIEISGHPFLLTIPQDVTDQLLLEKQLRQSQKMEAVGQLAAGIAHDFNNMLTVIQGNATLVLTGEPGPQAHHRPMLTGIVNAAQRSAKLVRQLLTFSHKQVVDIQPIEITDVLASISEMLPRMLGEHIEVSVSIAPDLPMAQADAGMIEQLLVNLSVNARDAMPRGGKLKIAANAAEFSLADVREHRDARPGRYMRIEVSDTGTGIPPDVLAHIFEPFFTTKPVGKGTGLGLATAYGIARQHDGWLEVDSEVDVGTTFALFLPVAEAAAAAAAVPTHTVATDLRGTETIFVVEDEETVRSCVCAILKSKGYGIITATNGVEALSVWKEQRDNIDLLLTDMVMPEGMTGIDLAGQLTAERPELKVIYTSGYSADIHGTDSSLPAGHRFLSKPYQSVVLVETVRETLDSVTCES